MATEFWLDPSLNEHCSMFPEVQLEVTALAESLAWQARSHLNQHYDEGDAMIEVEVAGNGKDRLVSLVDEAAQSIEYGHHAPDGSFVAGLNVMGGLL